MKYCVSVLFALLVMSTANAQEDLVDFKTGDSILQAQASRLPKFYKAYCDIRKDANLKEYRFVRREKAGPGSSNARGIINLNLRFIENTVPDFDDDRLVIVLYHELGHIYYARQTPVEQQDKIKNEQFAFEYSLKIAKEMADNGDCQPLQAGLKFMYQRSLSDNMEDVHVKALKILVKEPSFLSLQKFVETCK